MYGVLEDENKLTEFDFFMDEDVRARRIGILCLEKTLTPASGYRFEEKVRNSNNLSRCFRIDSRAHDLMQLTDLLLGITVFKKLQKKTTSSAKIRVIQKFDELFFLRKKRVHYDCIHELP